METLLKEKSAKTAGGDVSQIVDRRDEIDELLRIKQSRKIDANRVPCPCCGVVVETKVNHCPFCESDIAAETALARETMRRLRELSGELDAEHARRDDDEAPPRRGFFQRLKYLFEGDPTPDQEAPKVDPHAKRLLSHIAPGDSFKVLEEDGAWLKVKTMGGDIGWVYSTVKKDPSSHRSR